jgi:hypothetical protein
VAETGRRFTRRRGPPMNSPDATSGAPEGAGLFEVTGLAEVPDDEILERRRRIAQIEREEFHRHLTSRSFIGNAFSGMNEPLDEARRALDREIRRRRLS